MNGNPFPVRSCVPVSTTETSETQLSDCFLAPSSSQEWADDLLSEIQGPSPFRPGMTASVEIITTTKSNVLSVPLAAVTTRNENMQMSTEDNEEDNRAQSSTVSDEAIKEVVFVNDNGTAKMVEVVTGISDYDNIEIISGLEEGQEVISGPFFVVSKRIKDGDLIESTKQGDSKTGDTNNEATASK